MGNVETDVVLKYACGSTKPTAGSRQRFIMRRGQRSFGAKTYVIIWSILNAAMFVVTIPSFMMANRLPELVLVMNYLLLWLVLNVVGFIVIHYTSGPSIIEELPLADEGRGAVSGMQRPLARPLKMAS